MSIAPSRKSMHNLMNNGGSFSDLKIIKNGAELIVPQSLAGNTKTMKIIQAFSNELTAENIKNLVSLGVQCKIA